MSSDGTTFGDQPAGDHLGSVLGPFFTAHHVADWLHSTEEHVRDLTARGDLVVVPDVDGRPAYPTFQFDRNERLLPHVSWILRLIDTHGADPWGAALWLHTPDPAFGDTTAAEALRRGDCHLVLDAARDVYAAGRHA